MNTKIIITLLAALALLSGCASNSSGKVQNFLSTALPATFEGDAHVEHFNPWFDFTVDAKGLRVVDGKWTWESINYVRKDRFTRGSIILTPKPVP